LEGLRLNPDQMANALDALSRTKDKDTPWKMIQNEDTFDPSLIGIVILDVFTTGLEVVGFMGLVNNSSKKNFK